MRRVRAVLIGVIVAFGACGAASAQSVSSLTREQANSVATALGWTTGEAETFADGDFSQTYTLPSGMPVQLEGLACKKDDLDGCPEFQLNAIFGMGSPDAARALEAQLSYRWADAWVRNEEVVVVSRMEFLYGGVGLAHVKETFATFEQIANDAADKAFPCGLPSHGVAPDCPAASDVH